MNSASQLQGSERGEDVLELSMFFVKIREPPVLCVGPALRLRRASQFAISP